MRRIIGISGGTNVAAAMKLAQKLGKGKTVVTVFPDTAERYFSTPLFSDDVYSDSINGMAVSERAVSCP